MANIAKKIAGKILILALHLSVLVNFLTLINELIMTEKKDLSRCPTAAAEPTPRKESGSSGFHLFLTYSELVLILFEFQELFKYCFKWWNMHFSYKHFGPLLFQTICMIFVMYQFLTTFFEELTPNSHLLYLVLGWTLNSLRIGYLHHKRLGWWCGSVRENARVSEHGVDSRFESVPVEGGDSVRGENSSSEGVAMGGGRGGGGLGFETVPVEGGDSLRRENSSSEGVALGGGGGGGGLVSETVLVGRGGSLRCENSGSEGVAMSGGGGGGGLGSETVLVGRGGSLRGENSGSEGVVMGGGGGGGGLGSETVPEGREVSAIGMNGIMTTWRFLSFLSVIVSWIPFITWISATLVLRERYHQIQLQNIVIHGRNDNGHGSNDDCYGGGDDSHGQIRGDRTDNGNNNPY